MPSTQIQIVKWTFPAFALIIGLFWYKRRRVDRADPGGISKEATYKDKIPPESQVKINGVSLKSSLYDSGIHDESFTVSSSTPSSTEETVAASSPRKVSESLDIPVRKPASSQPISMQSGKSSESQSAWYKDVDTAVTETITDIQLGSNPKNSNFEMVARSRSGSSFEAVKDDGKIMKIFENVAEEEEQNPASSEVQPDQPENNDHCENSEEQPVDDSTEKTEKTIKSQVQAPSERDSANHSPVSGVLDGSVTDEARSEGSMDSGKGGSIKGHTKPIANAAHGDIYAYTIRIPQDLVGRLIGRDGSFLQTIRNNADVHVILRRHPMLRNHKICVIEGTTEGINVALGIIRLRFPEKLYPHITLEQVTPSRKADQIPWFTQLMQLSLVEGVNNDVIICHILQPNRVFVQLPTHPTYPSLRVLDASMTQLYDLTESPSVPDELHRGMIVVAKWYDKWVRAYVENPDPEKNQNLVRLVDHGGYWYFSHAEMRKIRSDYLTLPFQAIEIFIANVEPKDGEWKQEAYDVVAHRCSGIVAQAQIEAYINTNIYANLYLNISNYGVISLADELIARGYAEHVPIERIIPEAVPVV